MTINRELIDRLLVEAAASPRLRKNLDLRDAESDYSQRMLNALLPGTVMSIHRHCDSTETVMLLCGRMDEVFYDDNKRETGRCHLDAALGNYGVQIPRGAWHSVQVFEPTVILETKNGQYHPLSPDDILA